MAYWAQLASLRIVECRPRSQGRGWQSGVGGDVAAVDTNSAPPPPQLDAPFT